MDTSTIDQAYAQLQAEFQDVAKSVQALAEKLQAGDANAKEWLLDLKQVALDVKDEQIQVNSLLQAIHSYVDNSHQQLQRQAQQMGQPMGGGLMGGGRGGLFGGLLGGGFGRAMAMGAGTGLGDDLINSIF